MLSFTRNEVFSEKAVMVVSGNGSYAMLISGDLPSKALAVARSAPKMRDIVFNDLCIFDESLNYSILNDIAEQILNSAMNNCRCVELVKQTQAALSNLGYNVLPVYGFKVRDEVYMYDIGFEFRIGEVSIYVDFAFCGMYRYGQLAIGYDVTKESLIFRRENRKFGYFLDGCNNKFRFDSRELSSVITTILPECNEYNVSILSNLDILVEDVYSNLPPNSVRIFKAEGEELEPVISMSLLSATEFAIRTREQGANILKTVVTSGKSSGMTNVGTAKILSADEIEKLGDMILCVTTKTGMIVSEAEFMEAKHAFLSMDWPDTETQLKLGHAAGLSINELGNCTVINSESIKDISSNILDMQVSWSNNCGCHMIHNEAGETIGFLPCNGISVVYDKHSSVQKSGLQALEIEDQILTKSEIRNVAADSLNYEELIRETKEEIEHYRSKCAAFDFDYLIQSIRSIDEKVSRTYSTLSSLISSQALANAQAATRLQAIDLILKFPVKDAYSGYSSGTLIEYFSFKALPDGGTEVTIRDRHSMFPYMKRVQVKRCGKVYTSNNGSQVGVYDKNADYILVGSAYASSINDLQGKKIQCESIQFEVAPRQTTGSGKSETVVVKRTLLEPRVVCKYSFFLEQVRIILSNILNHDQIKASKQISSCIERVSQACDKYSSERKPYLEQLVEYYYNSEQLFINTHILELAQYRFSYEDQIAVNADISYVIEENNKFSEYETKIFNSIIQGFDVQDRYIDISEYRNNVNEIKSNIITNIKRISGFLEDSVNQRDHEVEETISYENLEFSCYVQDFETILAEADSLNSTDILIGAKKHTYNIDILYKEYVESEGISSEKIPYIETSILDIIGEINDQSERYLNLFNDLSNRLREALDHHEVKFNGKICNVIDGIISVTTDNFSASFQIETQIYKYDESGRSIVTKQDVDASAEYAKVTKIIPYQIQINGDVYKTVGNDIISLGSLVYDIKNFLQQYFIYKNIPLIDSVVSKISLNLLGYDERDSSVIFSAIRSKYGDQVANYFSAYVNRIENLDSMVTTFIFSAATNIELFVATMMASQDKKLGSLLLDKEVSLSSLASIKDVCANLVL